MQSMADITKGNVTLKDVARAAKTSSSTVVRALSSQGRISEATRARVRKVVAELGYRADWRGRSMVTGKTGLVGLLISSEQASWFGFEIIAALQEAMNQTDHKLMVISTGNVLENEERAVESMLTRRVEGLVVLSHSHVRDASHFESL